MPEFCQFGGIGGGLFATEKMAQLVHRFGWDERPGFQHGMKEGVGEDTPVILASLDHRFFCPKRR